jgi:mannose-1-phosphate guanylyltransferase
VNKSLSNPLAGIRALLLAGGYGTRLRPITNHTPKCLVEIGGKPLLAHWFETLFAAGLERALVNTHYLPNSVEQFCKASPYAPKIDLIYEPELLGTAGTLRANRSYFGQTTLLAHADNFTLFDPQSFIAEHRSRTSECLATMMTFETDNPTSCGIVDLNKDGVLIGYHEKVANPPGNIANAAVFLLEKEALNWLDLAPMAADFCEEIVPLGIGQFQTYFNGVYHRDIGTISSLNKANQDYLSLVNYIKKT